jgi:hypothetical protein
MATADRLPYSRDEFRAWLETLPPDEPFCIADCDPHTTYWRRAGVSLPLGELRNRALPADFELVSAIDASKEGWDRITPAQIVKLIDQLENPGWLYRLFRRAPADRLLARAH